MHNMASGKLWTRNFILGSVINFLIMVNYYTLMVVVTDYTMETFNASASLAGLTASIFVVGALAARLWGGVWIDAIGRKKLLVIGMVIMVVASALYFPELGLPVLIATRVLHGISYGITALAVSTIVTSIIPKEREGEGVGYFMLSNTLGTALGPFLGMMLVQAAGIDAVFTACLIAALVCMVGLLLFNPPKEKRKPVTHVHPSDLVELSAIRIGIVAFIIFFGYSSILTFLSSFASERGISGAASLFFVVYAAAMFISRLFTGKLFDRRGANVVMIPSFVAIIIGMTLVGLAMSGVELLVGAALLGIGIGTAQSCGLTIAVQKAPISRIGLANSTFYVLVDGGVGVGPLVLGAIAPAIGYGGLYLAMAGAAALALVLYLLLVARGQSRKAK